MTIPNVFRILPFCSVGIFFGIAILELLSPAPTSASVLVVKNGVADSSKGSLTYVLGIASEGDTLKFNIAELDTLRLKAEIVLTKGVSIWGRNAATGNRICLIGAPRVFILSGGAFNLTEIVLLGKYSQPARDYNGGVLKISGPGTQVSLDSVDVMGGMGWVRGAGILNEYASLHISNSKIASNTFGYTSTDGEGGGIYNLQGDVTISRSILSGNRGSEGGGIFNDQGFVAIEGTVISDNELFSGGSASGYSAGGGIYNSGRMSIVNSTISGNIAEAKVTWTVFDGDASAYGGGIYNEGVVSISNCTISGNSAPASTVSNDAHAEEGGGGIFNRKKGLVYLANSTIAFNGQEGIGTQDGITYAINTIVTGNKHDSWNGQRNGLRIMLDSCRYCSPSESESIVIGSGSEKIFGDAKAMLGEYGGLTPTIPVSSGGLAVGRGLRTGSIAWDTLSDTLFKPVYFQGSNWFRLDTRQPVPAGVKVMEFDSDQRGIKRNDPPCIGAYEYSGPATGILRAENDNNGLDVGLMLLRSLGDKVLLINAPVSGFYSIEIFTLKGEAVMNLKVKMERVSQIRVLPKNFPSGRYYAKVNNLRLTRSTPLVIE
jgi:hypothetical protein